MKQIIYLSDTSSHIYTDNTTTKFKTYIDPVKFNYVDYIEPWVAVKSITVSLTPNLVSVADRVLGVRSSICSEPIIRSNYFDRILCTFTISESFYSEDTKTITISFKNLIYFPSTIESLSSAEFSLVDINSDTELKINNQTQESSPTIIVVCIKQQRMSASGKYPFNLILESNTESSLKMFPDNTDMSFRTVLPRRLEFSRKWYVTLKALHLSSKIFNFHNESDLWISIESYVHWGKMGGIRMVDDSHPSMDEKIVLPSSHYATEEDIVAALNKIFQEKNAPIRLSFNIPLSRFIFRYTGDKEFIGESPMQRYHYCLITLSHKLSYCLGYSSDLEKKEEGKVKSFQFFPSKKLKSARQTFKARNPPNLWFEFPKQICIECDIIEHMLIGNRLVRSLRCVNIIEEKDDGIMSFIFQEHDYCEVKEKSFDIIHIKITDINGRPLKCERNGNTLVHLLFLNKW